LGLGPRRLGPTDPARVRAHDGTSSDELQGLEGARPRPAQDPDLRLAGPLKRDLSAGRSRGPALAEEHQMPRSEARRRPAKSSVLAPFSAPRNPEQRERERERCTGDAGASTYDPVRGAAIPHHVRLKRPHVHSIPHHSFRPGSLSKEPACADAWPREPRPQPDPMFCDRPGHPTLGNQTPHQRNPPRESCQVITATNRPRRQEKALESQTTHREGSPQTKADPQRSVAIAHHTTLHAPAGRRHR
jgi:hypothetical protein